MLDPPNDLHFREFTLSLDHKADLWWVTTRYSHTLEFLEITYTLRGTSIHICIRTDSLTLFQVDSEQGSYPPTATKLRHLVFQPGSQSVGWITTTLRAMTPEHRDLQQLSLHIPYYLLSFGIGVGQLHGGVSCREWLDG